MQSRDESPILAKWTLQEALDLRGMVDNVRGGGGGGGWIQKLQDTVQHVAETVFILNLYVSKNTSFLQKILQYSYDTWDLSKCEHVAVHLARLLLDKSSLASALHQTTQSK